VNRETARPAPAPAGTRRGRPARARPAPAGPAALPSAAGAWRSAPFTCSANVAAGQAGLSQMRRRTSSSTRTGRPPQARSCRQRRYRSCTRADSVPQPRQATGPEPVRATIFTLPSRSSTRSRSSPLRCGNSKDSRPASLPVSSCSTTTPTVARHDQDPGDPDRDKTAVPMRNELRDREPAVSPAQPLVQDTVASVGEAPGEPRRNGEGPALDGGRTPTRDRTIALPGFPSRRRRGQRFAP
jgi:hypothetical protein